MRLIGGWAGRLGWLLLCAAAAFADPSPETVLQRAAESADTARFTAVGERLETQSDGSAVSVKGEWRSAGRKRLFRVTSGPAPYKGSVSADDGERRVVYLPLDKRLYVFKGRGGHGPPEPDLARLRSQYSVRGLGRGTIAGRSTHKIELSPRGGGGLTHKLWIDAEEYVPLRREMLAGERVVQRHAFERVNFSPSLNEDSFRFAPPRGTTTVSVGKGERSDPLRLPSASAVRERVGVRMMQPTYVPKGFELEGYFAYPPSPFNPFNRRLAVRYAKGTSVLVLYVGAGHGPGRRGESSAEPREVKPGVFFWAKNGVRLVLIGPREADRGELRRSAESVDWYDA